MNKHGIGSGILLGLALAVGAFLPDMAHATSAYGCDYVGLTNHVAGCIRDTLDNTTDAFFDGIYPIFSRAITGIMTLAVIVFGVMASFGMLEKPGRDSIMLVLKLGMVAWLSTQSDVLYDKVINIMDTTAEAVISFVPDSGPITDNSGAVVNDFSQVTCLKAMHDAQAASTSQPGVSAPWIAMDCMIDSVIGIRVATSNPLPAGNLIHAFNERISSFESGPARGLLYLFFSAMQTSIMGVILALIGFVFIWGTINLIIKALFIYLAGYLGLAALMIFAPLFIPMILFQSTKSYFDKWIKLLISFALQPVIILVFVTFTIAAVDLATFSGDYSIMYRLAGNCSRQQGFSLNAYLKLPRSEANPTGCQPANPAPADAKSVIRKVPTQFAQVKADTVNPVELLGSNAGSIVDGLENSKCTKTLMDADPNLANVCNQNYALQIFHDSLDWELLARARLPAVTVPPTAAGATPVTPGQQLSREVMASIIFAAVVVFIMNRLLHVIPMVAYDLIGDFGQSPNLAQTGGGLPGADKLKSAMSSMVNKR